METTCTAHGTVLQYHEGERAYYCPMENSAWPGTPLAHPIRKGE